MDIISNDSLRNNLSYLYSNRYTYLDNIETTVDDKYQWDYLYPQILKHIKLDEIWVSGSPKDYDKMLEDEDFYEVIKLNIANRKYMQSQYERLRDLVSSIIEQIDRHKNSLKK